MLNELKDTMNKELKGIKKTMSEQNENINKEIGIIKRNQAEILELQSIKQMKNSLEEFNNRFELARQKISNLDDNTIELLQSEEQKEKKKKNGEI